MSNGAYMRKVTGSLRSDSFAKVKSSRLSLSMKKTASFWTQWEVLFWLWYWDAKVSVYNAFALSWLIEPSKGSWFVGFPCLLVVVLYCEASLPRSTSTCWALMSSWTCSSWYNCLPCLLWYSFNITSNITPLWNSLHLALNLWISSTSVSTQSVPWQVVTFIQESYL